MILIAAEFPDELEIVNNSGVLKDGDAVLISPSPKVQYEARKKGLAVLSLRRCFARESHERTVLAKNALYNELKGISGEIVDSLGVQEAYSSTYFFLIRHFLSHLMSLVEITQNAIDAVAAHELVAVRLTKRVYSDDLEGGRGFDEDGHIFRYERYLADLVERVCRTRKIGFQTFDLPVRYNSQVNSPNVFATFARKVIPGVLRQFERAAALQRHRGRKLILCPSLAYGTSTLLENLFMGSARWVSFILSGHRQDALGLWRLLLGRPDQGQALFPMYFKLLCLQAEAPDPIFEESKSLFVNKIRGALQGQEFFNRWSYRDVFLGDLLLERTVKFLEPFLEALHRSVATANVVLDRVKPDIVISQMSFGVTAALGELCKKRGIPSVMISHGSHVPMRNIYEEIIWKNHGQQLMTTNFEHLALQTPWAEKFLAQAPAKSQCHRTGPLLLSRVNGTSSGATLLKEMYAPNGEKVILHASTPKPRSAPRLYVYETEDEYVANMIDLAEAVETTPGYALIIRFRPTRDLSLEDLRELIPAFPRLSIRGDGEFKDYLTIADLVVSFSSTAIEEALLSHKGVVQYDPTGRYCHIPARVFDAVTAEPGAVYFVDRKERLAPMLQWALLNHFPRQADSWFVDHEFKTEDTLEFKQMLEKACAAVHSPEFRSVSP